MKAHQELLKSLKEQFESNTTTIADYEATALSSIIRWQWATEPQFYLEQLSIERSRKPKGRLMKNEPAEKKYCVRMGYNANDQLVYEEAWTNHPTNGYKKFYLNQVNQILSYTFKRNGKLDEIELLKLENSIPSWFGNVARHKASSIDNYTYEVGKLSEIRTMWVSEPYVQFPLYKINYDEFDNLKLIVRTDAPSDFFPEGQQIEVFQQTAYSLKALTTIFVEETMRQLKAALIAPSNKTPNCLLLVLENPFNSEDWLPLKFGFRKVELNFETEGMLKDFFDLELLELLANKKANAALTKVSNLLMQEIELKEKYDLPYKLLIKIAKELKKWLKTQAGISDQLMIFPLDFPDDYSLETVGILRRIYSVKEIK